MPSNEAERSCGNSSLVMLHFRAGQALLVPEGEEGQRSLQLHKTGSVLHLRQLLLTIVHCFVYFPNFFSQFNLTLSLFWFHDCDP